ncbi:hypothetical protein ACFCP7_24690 [Paenibacillus elgii]
MIKQTNVYTFATLSDIAGGRKYSEEEIKGLIQNLSLGGILVILSQMGSFGAEDPRVRKLFFKYLNDLGLEELSGAFKNHVLYSEQGLLMLWKWIFAHGIQDSLSASVNPVLGINQIIHLCISISDYLYDQVPEEEAKYYIFSNVVFNNKADLGSDLARALLIFDEIAKDRRNFTEKEFIDIHSAFSETYGYTIREYLAVVFGLISSFFVSSDSKSILNPNWNKSSNFFENIQNPALGEAILNELSMSFSEASSWSQNNFDKPWDFTKFRQKPLLRLDNGNFYPISLRFLFDKVLSELYFKIREAFPRDNTQVISFFGRCFEKYLEISTGKSLEVRKRNPYIFIPEFSYGKKRSNRSPDVMLRLGDTLLAVEAKVYRLKMNSLFGNKESIDEDTQRIAVEPIIQLHKRLSELQALSHPMIKGVSKIYLMSVTFGDFPTLKPFEEKISQSIGTFKLPVKGCFHLDIEEYEMLMELLSRNSSAPIFAYLDNKQQLGPHMSFKNFLFASHLHPRRPRFTRERMFEHLQGLKTTLFQ